MEWNSADRFNAMLLAAGVGVSILCFSVIMSTPSSGPRKHSGSECACECDDDRPASSFGLHLDSSGKLGYGLRF